MNATQMVFELKTTFKEQICRELIKKYLELHDGKHPNFEQDEEYVLTKDDIDEKVENYIQVDLYSTYDEYCDVVEMPINKYIVTLDYNLFFIVGEEDNEYEWSEIGIDDIAKILDFLTKKSINL